MGEPVRVAQVGPGAEGRGGMSAVIGEIIGSDLGRSHGMRLISTYESPRPGPRLLRFLRALIDVIAFCARPGHRVVHVHATVRGSAIRKAALVLTARAMGRPVILHFHGGAHEIDAFRRRLGAGRARVLSLGLGAATRTFAVSTAGARALERAFGVTGAEVLHNPVPRVTPRAATAAPGPLAVLFLGGFENPVKGGQVLLDALDRMGPRAADLEVLLAGPGAAPDLAAGGFTTRKLGYLDADGKAAAFARAEIFVLPSTSEGLPMALLEAMAHGSAIVATRVGAVPEILTDRTDALLVPPGDPEALAGALAELVVDGELRGRLGGGALRRAEDLRRTDSVEQLRTVYRELAGASRPSPDRPSGGTTVPHLGRLANRAGSPLFLGYHSIAAPGPEYLSVSPEAFDRQLASLRRAGYRSGTRADLDRVGRRTRERIVFLTFDDGFEDNFATAAPLLRQHGFTAHIFLLPRHLDAGAPLRWPEVEGAQARHPDVMRSMTWSMVEALAAEGHEFGSHTVSHRWLTRLGDEELRQELGDSRRELAARLGRCDTLAYPFGDWDVRVALAAADAGYRWAFALPFGGQSTATPMSVPRVPVDERDVGLRFALKRSAAGRAVFLSPIRPALRRLRGSGPTAPGQRHLGDRA